MTVIVVLSQTMRQREAGMFLSDINADRKIAVTQFQHTLDEDLFPPETMFMSWSTTPGVSPSAVATNFMNRMKSSMRGGSLLGVRIDRWLRSAEWRLRYLDRAMALLESRRGAGWNFDNSALIDTLQSCLGGGECEVVVFDLFDLPTALRCAETQQCRVLVR